MYWMFASAFWPGFLVGVVGFCCLSIILLWMIGRSATGVAQKSSLRAKLKYLFLSGSSDYLATKTGSEDVRILSQLNVGIVLYGADGRLIFSNDCAEQYLRTDHLPPYLNEFLKIYCEKNGILARLALGKQQAMGQLSLYQRVLKITARVIMNPHPGKKETVFMIQDHTGSALQEQKRKEFVANVSHELKTPLTTIITYSESLEDWGIDEKNKESIKSDVHRIYEDAIRMKNLVTDLLLLSSIDSQALQMRMEDIDLNILVKQTVDRMKITAQEQDIQLECVHMTKVPDVFGDHPSLERIFSNLLSNAIKYSNSGSSVKVFIGQVHDVAYVKISDSGQGIEAKHLNKIFDRFYRVDMTGSRAYGGTGLGLSIVKELVEMHNGQISVQSALGRGTTFTVMLPFAYAIHRQTLDQLKQKRPLRDSIQQASLNQILSVAKQQGITFNIAQDLTIDDIEQLKKMIDESLADVSLHQEEIAIETAVQERSHDHMEASD